MSTQTANAGYNIPEEHAELWRQLQEFVFDEPGVEYNFSKRLAKRNKWDIALALRVIEEYRKFLFLLKVTGHMVTPSTFVDEAWHLHLIYTYSYWEVLCMRIFKQPIHHHPGNGSDADQAKFAALYERTLEDYKGFFGAPPVQIWGKPNESIDWRAILAALPVLPRRAKSTLLELFPQPSDEAL